MRRKNSDLLMLDYQKLYMPISYILQCTSNISHNAPFCNRNVRVYVIDNMWWIPRTVTLKMFPFDDVIMFSQDRRRHMAYLP